MLDRYQTHEFVPGTCIGYEDGEQYFLFSDLAHKTVRKFCEEQGESFPISAKGLLKALAEEGLIETSSGQNTKSVRIGGKSKRVVCLDKYKAKRIADSAL